MEKTLIEKIKDAEKEAAEEKEQYVKEAERLISEAEENAKRSLETNAEVCKAYYETQIRLANVNSEKAYKEEIKRVQEECASAVENAVKSAATEVSGIVDRIIGGEKNA